MEPKERFNKLLDKYKNDPEYILQGIILRVSEKIAGLMQDRRMTRGQLAEKLGCSPAYVTKLLRGSENLTLRKLGEVSIALDADLAIDMVPSIGDAIKRRRGHSDSTAIYTQREANTRTVAESKRHFARKRASKNS
jgi:transcriptional regulator with XRE-family HTH domain